MPTISANTNRLPWCCGVIEVGYFQNHSLPKSSSNITEETPEKLLETILKKTTGYPVLFNFYREIYYRDNDDEYYDEPREENEYEAADLRELVMKHPNAMHLANFVNPNSGNRVDSWMIFEGEIPYEAD